MKKFKVTFRFAQSSQIVSQIVKAIDEDEAVQQVFDMYDDDDIQIDEIFDVFDTPLAKKHIHIDMPDGFTYAIPVMVIAEHKASKVTKYNGDLNFYQAMTTEVLPEFESDEYAIKDWAKNNMNWADVKKYAVRLEKKQIDYQDVWVNGEMTIG